MKQKVIIFRKCVRAHSQMTSERRGSQSVATLEVKTGNSQVWRDDEDDVGGRGKKIGFGLRIRLI